MKFETIKTYVLFLLIGISLLLTFSLWSNELDGDYLSSDVLNEEDFNLGGKELSKREIITPSNIIFEKYHHYYGFSHPQDSLALYRDMQSWVLYDYREAEANGRPNDNNQVEIIFPMELPMEIVPSLFKLNDDDDEDLMPSWSFQRAFITFESSKTLTIQFLSVDGREQVKFDINSPTKHDMLMDYITNLEGLIEYTVLQEKEMPIYFPNGELTMSTRSYAFDTVDSLKLVNALFTNPKEVITNPRGSETYYQDGQRTMMISEDKRSMEYTNPQETSYDIISPIELLDNSITNINEYKGWINNYRLQSINTAENIIRYQMYVDAYPVFDHNSVLNIIEQQWRNNGLYQYSSPLISLNNSYPSLEEVTLPSGREISHAIKSNDKYNLDDIRDIQIGYRIYVTEKTIVKLEPAWFIDINGRWEEVSIDDTHSKGVS
ncbi:hypothetical protein GMD78_07120 [Ornithinibacillus sp. L9]|uniref:Regulatory protein YycH domain-containing protein n=1 Tax=Ornithinibacillus caprae TaxID=2678566 RepID=A0A6N8FIR1_9BACI|nr:two-component system activity regulator YycH [Ornithinibacillus caprae]MUK88164.1 hypothetical protein [Ornithinibacillus caprae]